MSWKMTKEVRDARHSGLLKNLNQTEYFILFIMADTCRGESRTAKIGASELMTQTGNADRTAISRAINKLITVECIKRRSVGNQYSTASYELLALACCADATSIDSEEHVACCADATPTGGEHVASPIPHVASPTEHVALEHGACCAGATHPSSTICIPPNTPEGERASAPPPTPTADPAVINGELMPANPYARLGFVPSTVEEPLGGITPPSRFCPDHQPNKDAKCWRCNGAKTYRNDDWPTTANGVKYTEMKNTITQMAIRDGRRDARLGDLARLSGRTIDEQEHHVVDMMDQFTRRQEQKQLAITQRWAQLA